MPMANGVGKICYKKRGLSMSAIAIITARGGSKRIPKKNIKEFCGKPIIAYSIEAAFASKIFTEVMVSTDDPEIADIAIQRLLILLSSMELKFRFCVAMKPLMIFRLPEMY